MKLVCKGCQEIPSFGRCDHHDDDDNDDNDDDDYDDDDDDDDDKYSCSTTNIPVIEKYSCG